MKRTLITVLLLVGVLGFSQTSKKKVFKKKVAKKTYPKKPTVKKTTAVAKPIETTEKVTETKEVLPIATATEVVKEKPKEQEPPKQPDYEITAEKLAKKNGWINNRNSFFVRGIEGFVKGVYSGNGKIYVLLEIANRTNINYDIESAVFITAPTKKAEKEIEMEEKIFQPIFSNQPETFNKKEKKKIVYVFDKFTIADDKKLLFVMNETDGERTVTLDIKPSYIINAEFVK